MCFFVVVVIGTLVWSAIGRSGVQYVKKVHAVSDRSFFVWFVLLLYPVQHAAVGLCAFFFQGGVGVQDNTCRMTLRVMVSKCGAGGLFYKRWRDK